MLYIYFLYLSQYKYKFINNNKSVYLFCLYYVISCNIVVQYRTIIFIWVKDKSILFNYILITCLVII